MPHNHKFENYKPNLKLSNVMELSQTLIFGRYLYGVTISPEKLYYREKKRIALYSSAHILCGVYGWG